MNPGFENRFTAESRRVGSLSYPAHIKTEIKLVPVALIDSING
jgi:hypothetical protein